MAMIRSESESSAESRSFNIFMDMFFVDGFFDDLSDTEWGISGGVKIFGSDMEGTLGLSPLIDLVELH